MPHNLPDFNDIINDFKLVNGQLDGRLNNLTNIIIEFGQRIAHLEHLDLKICVDSINETMRDVLGKLHSLETKIEQLERPK